MELVHSHISYIANTICSKDPTVGPFFIVSSAKIPRLTPIFYRLHESMNSTGFKKTTKKQQPCLGMGVVFVV